MMKFIAVIVLSLFARYAQAEECPDFYRFVDFGIADKNGMTYRGGPTFRAEAIDGQPMLILQSTNCLSVQEISKDGHGNPIPVVQSINYDPEKSGIDLVGLRVFVTDNAKAEAQEKADVHLMRIKQQEVSLTRGPNFLCARLKGLKTLSCQFVSPYPGNAVLVVYCDVRECRMPTLAINEKLAISASWNSDEAYLNVPELAGAKQFDKVQQIYGFLKPLSSIFSTL